MRRRLAIVLLCFVSLTPVTAIAEHKHIVLDPGQTVIEFSVGSTLHDVKGTAPLERGELWIDLKTGVATGVLRVAAAEVTTNHRGIDKRMHGEVLESEKYPVIAFRPARLRVTEERQVLEGVFEIHGGSHPFEMPIDLEVGPPFRLSADFEVPYVEWGMKDVSFLFLRLDKTVNVSLRSEGVRTETR